MRQSIAAFALFHRESEGRALWLAQWNERWEAFHLVGGHKRPTESFRECAIREVSEELRLAEDKEFVVADQPVAHLEYSAWSRSANEQTGYIMELFEARLVGREADRIVNSLPSNRWLSESEILAKKSNDGLAVSETMERLLAEARA